MKKMSAILLVAALLLPTAAVARDAENNWGALQSIPSGQLLTVKTFSGKSLKGLFQQATDSAIRINADGKDMEIPSAEVSRVYVLRGKPVLKATLIGAAVGGAAGAGLWAAAGEDSDKTWFMTRDVTAATGAGIGLAAGTIVGLVIGSSRNNRILIYKAARAR